ncbi:MAG: DegT/DnrJ/EryC1/StrS family aminotransferase [Euryarchaeota archaeon]|nr:DegT/DnrJ/EryC1/StrS family aminotransferase [Euryarchaeota archaeon]
MFVDDETRQAALRVIESGRYIKGPEGEAFEKEFAAKIGTKHGIAVSSGTAALHIAYLAAGIGPGDEVIVPSHSFIATAAPLIHIGAVPVFADIDPVTFTILPREFSRLKSPRTKAVVPVHIYGQSADMSPIVEAARGHGIRVIEDAAQAHLAEYGGKRIGTLGDVAIFSFFPSKNMTVAGDGGMLTTDDDRIAATLRMLRDAGRAPGQKYEHEIPGFNYRLSEIQSAIGRVQLKHLEAWTAKRRENAAYLQDALAGTKGVTLPTERTGSKHVWHQFVIRYHERDRLWKHLEASGIEAGVHYPIPIHLQPAFKTLPRAKLAETERAAAEILSIPVHQKLTRADLDYIAGAVRDFAGGAK